MQSTGGQIAPLQPTGRQIAPLQTTGGQIAPLPSESSLLEKVQRIVADHMGIPISRVTPKSSFVQDLHFDSLDQVELVMELEDRFEFSISDEDAERITTVEEAVAHIEAALKSKK